MERGRGSVGREVESRFKQASVLILMEKVILTFFFLKNEPESSMLKHTYRQTERHTDRRPTDRRTNEQKCSFIHIFIPIFISSV